MLAVLPETKDVHIRWYNREGNVYTPLPDSNKFAKQKVKEETILFSGFRLTDAGRLYKDFSEMVIAELTK